MDRRDHRKGRRTSGQEVLDLADLARFRQAAYRIFSTMLFYPGAERLSTAAAIARELRDQGDFLATFSFFIQWRELLDTLRDLDDLRPLRLQEEYVEVFMVNPDYPPCLPYESSYVESGTGVTGWTAVKLEREYRAAGLVLSDTLEEPPDHAAVELEFMSFLCNQEACAWDARRLAESIEVLERQADFLKQHLSRWFPVFARGVAGKNSSEIYAVVTRAAQTFIGHDRDLLEALIERFGSRAKTHPADPV
ncbi:MAG: molecular chaperone [Candidatus Binatia bacterium]